MSIFSTEEQERIMHAINLAENRTSGEIQVVVERNLKDAVLLRARYFFEKLGMHKTVRRNGVIIYIAIEDHQFAILGDQGINDLVPPDFWDSTKDNMLGYFKRGAVIEGLIAGIELAGEQLYQYFPKAHDDINELPNEIFFGDR